LGLGKKVYFSGQEFSLLPEEKIQLKGRHNLENIQAAAKVAEILDINPGITKQAIAEFRGLEHRLEFVAEKGGIKFYDDSFSTTPESAVAAIKAFSEPLVAILGGSKKNSDFTELAKTIAQTPNIRALILIGEEAPRIKQAIGEFLKVPKPLMLEGAKNMPEIFNQINQVAKAGDAVLLSPACASFGMFKNYKDRGEQFKNLVLNWN
jgi:UDP-N-acetylmuramoylalanine--D-glutamate ligase